ncbi:MAG: glycosyltransferase family 1 protein, partial [Ornithinimicrobium sp.]
MTRPRVLVLAFSTLRSDARVLRQITLLSSEYDVSTVGYGTSPPGVIEHLRIPDELVAWHKRRGWLIARCYQRAYDSAPVIRFLRSRLCAERWDAIVANDVETVPLALTLNAGGVHADLHEYATRQNEQSWRWRWFVAPYNAWIVRRWVTCADSVSTVGEELAKEYWREFGIEA